MTFYARILIVLLFLPQITKASDYFKNKPHFIEENLKQTKYDIDTSATAVVLYEKYTYDVTNVNFITRINVKRIVKILKKTGVSYGDEELSNYSSYEDYSKVSKIAGTTYNLENGRVTKQSLDGDEVFKGSYGNWKEKKFSMPSVKEGSIVEYTYEINTDLGRHFCKWDIQEDIPVLYKELEVKSPKRFEIAELDQNLPYFETDVDEETAKALPEAYILADTLGMGVVDKRWVRRNVTALSEEPFVSSMENYKEEKELFIKGVYISAQKDDPFYTWEKINELLIKSPSFYKAISTKNKDASVLATQLAEGAADDLEKAKKIFSYIRDSITKQGDGGIYIMHHPDDVLDQKSGSIADINILLISMLQAVDIDCSPVILSTKGHGRPGLFPDLSKFNYTICEADIKGRKYYLDASGKYNPFGVLPEKCYNGYVRVIKKEGDYRILFPDSTKEKSFIRIVTKDTSINNYTISIDCVFGDYAAMKHRAAWNGGDGVKEYVVSLLKSLPFNVHLKDYTIQNLKNTDGHLSLNIIAVGEWPADDKVIYLNPYLLPYFEKNPFTNPNRKYAVELPYTYNVTYYYQLLLPQGYTVDENIEPLNMRFDDNARYQDAVTYDKVTNMISVNANMSIYKTTYSADQYPFLKDFFDKMISQQQKNIVIKKQ